jgi:uncharacterized protein
MAEFIPRRALRSGHVMTVYSWGKPRRFPGLAPVDRYFDVAPGVRVLGHCHWQRERARHPALLALHGLEGSSSAHYMRGLAQKAFAAGFNVVLLNQRNCGGTEELSETLYHSGLTGDAVHVLRELTEIDGIDRIAVAGYSLGGNLALKLAGDYGADAPAHLRAVCAVSPILEVGICVRALERRQNFIYQWNFVRGLKRRMRRKEHTHPGRFPLERLGDVRTVRQFDEYFTAPHFGFAGADDYYHKVSATRVIDRIRIPTMIITAEDDPFVPVEPFRDPRLTSNPNIRLIITRHGGHCGFITTGEKGGDCYWAEDRIIEFVTETVSMPNDECRITNAE